MPAKRPRKTGRKVTLIDPIERPAPTGLAKPEPSKRQKKKHPHIRGSEARTVRRRGARITTGFHPMGRLHNKMLAGEAGVEKSFWPVVDFLYGDLVDASAQPFTTHIELFGKVHEWTPDGMLTLRGGRQILIEVKPLIELQPEDGENPFGKRLPAGVDPKVYAEARLEAWKKAAAARGCEFRAISEVEIRTEPRFYNAKIWHRSKGNMPEDIRLHAIRALETGPATMTVAELADHFGSCRASGLLFACQLDRDGFIRLDRTDFFSPRTIVTNLSGPNAK